MTGLRIGSTVLNVSDVRRAAGFWCAVLGYEPRDGELDERFTVLAPPGGGWSAVSLQRSTRPRLEPTHVHLDLYAGDYDAELARVLALGAQVVRPRGADDDFVVLADPDGNEFCVIDKGQAQPGG